MDTSSRGLEDLLLYEQEYSVEHELGIRIHAPSCRQEKKYECLRCQKTKPGPRFAAVRFNTLIGVCRECCDDEEISQANRLPSAQFMRPKAAEKKTKGREFTTQLMTATKAKEAVSVEVKPCGTCGNQLGGLVDSFIYAPRKICGLCHGEEIKQLATTPFLEKDEE